jgi:hypothetical protein
VDTQASDMPDCALWILRCNPDTGALELVSSQAPVRQNLRTTVFASSVVPLHLEFRFVLHCEWKVGSHADGLFGRMTAVCIAAGPACEWPWR